MFRLLSPVLFIPITLQLQLDYKQLSVTVNTLKIGYGVYTLFNLVYF